MKNKSDTGLLASMCEAIIEDANDILAQLNGADELEAPTWWTSKLAVSSAYINSLRDFIIYNKEELVEEPETEDEEPKTEDELVDQPVEAEDDSMLPPSVRMMKNAT